MKINKKKLKLKSQYAIEFNKKKKVFCIESGVTFNIKITKFSIVGMNDKYLHQN